MKVTIPGDQPINLQSGDTLTFTWTTTMSPDGPPVSSDTYCLPMSYDDYGLPIPAGSSPPTVPPSLTLQKDAFKKLFKENKDEIEKGREDVFQPPSRDPVPASEIAPAPVKHRLQLLELD